MNESITTQAAFAGPDDNKRRQPLTFSRFVPTPENRAALLAARRAAAAVAGDRKYCGSNPLLLHGSSGTGKSHLAAGLVADVLRQRPDQSACVMTARDFANQINCDADEAETEARTADVLVVEDLQHLPSRSAETLVQVFDARAARRLLTVCTATLGPRGLDMLGSRFTSRLAGGLVVALELLSPASRLTLLRELAQRRQLAVADEALVWLAQQLTGGGRQLEGAIYQLAALARLQPRPPKLADIIGHFGDLSSAARPTVERIAQRISGFFQVDPRQLCSARRSRQVLLPRQVGMYLARQLTGLSLGQIGTYLGGRDHSTVLHACRKIEETLRHDATVAGAVCQLRSELS